MAIPIFAVGNRRLVTKHTDFYFHELGNTFDKEERLSVSDIRTKEKSLATSQGWYSDFIAQQTGDKFTATKVLALMKEETFLLPEQAKELGLVHDII
ncbi:MAG: ATP-dependent Clp protease proteolytic subunit [Patescibacteria group bacterium]|nr:ATP-dependent Clp protease proteolytic subunit [Patescibacteria group bacterium]